MDINSDTLENLLKEFGSNNERDSRERSEPGDVTPHEPHEKVSELAPRGSISNIPPLFNATAPAVELQREKYQHRLIAMLKSSGLDNREIAELTGYSATAIGYIVKQSHVQAMILERIHGTGDRAMLALHEAAEGAAQRLIKLSQEAENEECRRKANNDVLDRKYGKPNQPYSVNTKTADELSDSELAKFVQTN